MDSNDKHIMNFISFSNKTPAQSQRGRNLGANTNMTGQKNVSHRETYINSDNTFGGSIDLVGMNLLTDQPNYRMKNREGANMLRFLQN